MLETPVTMMSTSIYPIEIHSQEILYSFVRLTWNFNEYRGLNTFRVPGDPLLIYQGCIAIALPEAGFGQKFSLPGGTLFL